MEELMGLVALTDDEVTFSNTSSDMATLTSRPDYIQRHDISDEELTRLDENQTGNDEQITYIAFGGLLGLLPSTCTLLWKLKTSAAPTTTEVITSVIFCAILPLFIYAFVRNRDGKKYRKSLVAEIRSRSTT